MRLRRWLATKLAEVWGFDVLGFFITLNGAFVLAILDRTIAALLFLALTLFFLGFFVARQVYTPAADRPQFGIQAMTAEEFEEFKHGRR